MTRVLGLFFILTSTPTTLLAYTDPGTGMLIWQSILAVSVGFLFTTRRLLARVFKRDR